MDKPKLHKIEPKPHEPDATMIANLSLLLDMARQGKVKAYGVAFIDGDDETCVMYDPGPDLLVAATIGSIEVLKQTAIASSLRVPDLG